MKEVTIRGCKSCCFKYVDYGPYSSVYPMCTFPVFSMFPKQDPPSAKSVYEATEQNTAPQNCPMREGVVFVMVEEEEKGVLINGRRQEEKEAV